MRRHKCCECPKATPTGPLSLNDWLFVEACLETIKKYGHVNRIEAYHAVYPQTTYNSAKASAWKKFTNPAIPAAIETRLKAEGLKKESIMSVMWEAVEHARHEGKDEIVLTGCMDLLKVRGEVVERHQDMTSPPMLTPEQLTEELRRRGFAAVPSN